jgi:hypothetical protein
MPWCTLAAMTGQHMFHRILTKSKDEKTEVDKAMVAAILSHSTQARFAAMTVEQVFDHFVKEYDAIYKAAQ